VDFDNTTREFDSLTHQGKTEVATVIHDIWIEAPTIVRNDKADGLALILEFNDNARCIRVARGIAKGLASDLVREELNDRSCPHGIDR
jgi:hypothetical protein